MFSECTPFRALEDFIRSLLDYDLGLTPDPRQSYALLFAEPENGYVRVLTKPEGYSFPKKLMFEEEGIVLFKYAEVKIGPSWFCFYLLDN